MDMLTEREWLLILIGLILGLLIGDLLWLSVLWYQHRIKTSGKRWSKRASSQETRTTTQVDTPPTQNTRWR